MAGSTEERVDRRLSSIADAQHAMPRLIAELNDDPRLARAALANPLLAIEELGWSIDESVRSSFERRVRFSAETAARLDELEANIAAIVGRHVEVDDAHELAKLLFDDLRLTADAAQTATSSNTPSTSTTATARRAKKSPTLEPTGVQRLPTTPLEPRLPWLPAPAEDPLAVLAGAHPVIAPLLEYRQLDAGAPRLASPELYRRARDETTSIGSVTFRRHRPAADGPSPTEAPPAPKPKATRRPATRRRPGTAG